MVASLANKMVSQARGWCAVTVSPSVAGIRCVIGTALESNQQIRTAQVLLRTLYRLFKFQLMSGAGKTYVLHNVDVHCWRS
jgi:hypothetical protein